MIHPTVARRSAEHELRQPEPSAGQAPATGKSHQTSATGRHPRRSGGAPVTISDRAGGGTATGNDNLGATRQTHKELAGRLRNGSRRSAEQRSAPRPQLSGDPPTFYQGGGAANSKRASVPSARHSKVYY
jgi:hypothetical protein